MTTKILVTNKDLGFFTQTPITVQRLDEDGELLSCNHDGYEVETELVHIPNPHGQDDEYEQSYDVCDKCKAFRREGEDYWEVE